MTMIDPTDVDRLLAKVALDADEGRLDRLEQDVWQDVHATTRQRRVSVLCGAALAMTSLTASFGFAQAQARATQKSDVMYYALVGDSGQASRWP